MGRKIHWNVCRKIVFDVNEKWYKYEPEKVVEIDSQKIIWDFIIETDHAIEAGRPDLVIISPRLGNTGLMSRGEGVGRDSLVSWGEVSSLALLAILLVMVSR